MHALPSPPCLTCVGLPPDPRPPACLRGVNSPSRRLVRDGGAALSVGWGGFNACLLPIHGAGRGGAAQPALPSLIQLSSPFPSAAHACMVTFPLALGVQSLCVTGFEACLLCEALHETEESRTHHARLIPLAAVSCSVSVSLSPSHPHSFCHPFAPLP